MSSVPPPDSPQPFSGSQSPDPDKGKKIQSQSEKEAKILEKIDSLGLKDLCNFAKDINLGDYSSKVQLELGKRLVEKAEEGGMHRVKHLIKSITPSIIGNTLGRDYSNKAIELAKTCFTKVKSEIERSEELLELESSVLLFNQLPGQIASGGVEEREKAITNYNTVQSQGKYEDKLSLFSQKAFDALFKELDDEDKGGMIGALLKGLNQENLSTFKEYLLKPEKSDLLECALKDKGCQLSLMQLYKGIFEDIYAYSEGEYNSENMAFIGIADFYLNYISQDLLQPDVLSWSKFEIVKNKLNNEELNQIYEECKTHSLEKEARLLNFIKTNFISTDGDYQVNVNDKLRKQGEKGDLTGALNEILAVLNSDILPRYIKKRGEEHPEDLYEFYKGIM